MYSHYTRNLHGETIARQDHAKAPFMDEVQQMVAVNTGLNYNPTYGTKAYFHHQAGAYQKDSPYTDVPFFSPSLAKHCEGNYCAFASWGTQAHVATPFTSPVLYITKYTNCGEGVIELTQMMHNFAPAPTPAPIVDQTYFNVGWGGVRSSTLPHAIEPKSDGSLLFADPNDVDYLEQCGWSDSHLKRGYVRSGGVVIPEQILDLDDSGGYTSFVSKGLLVNRLLPAPEMPCRNNTHSTCADDVGNCMVNSCVKHGSARACLTSCTDSQVAAGTRTRMELRVQSNKNPACKKHGNDLYSGYPAIKCNFHDTQFGQTSPNLSSPDACAPWASMGLKNTLTGEVLEVAHINHWSWGTDEKLYLSIYETDATTAINTVNNFFDNTGNNVPLPIEVVSTTDVESVPTDYNPSALSAFTFVYGKGEDYTKFGGSVKGSSRRRLGSSSRDYTVFTVNWWNGSKLGAGDTYINRSFVFASELGVVKEIGDDLIDKVYVDKVAENEYDPRRIGIYRLGDSFSVETAAKAEGQFTTCSSSSATLVCSGTSTPSPGNIPFFYITCGLQTHFGSDPYHFTPDFGATFPNHATISKYVRSYVCDGQDETMRPSWKLIGFFGPNEAGCTDLATSVYDASVCPSAAESPTKESSKSPSSSPTTANTSSSRPSSSPSKQPTNSPTTAVPTMPPTTAEPTGPPTPKPTNEPTIAPGFTVTIPGSVSISNVPATVNTEFINGLETVLTDLGCSSRASTRSCVANVLSINGQEVNSNKVSVRRRQLLEPDTLEILYEIIMEAVCATSCDEAAAVQDIADEVYKEVTGTLKTAMKNGSLVNDLKETSPEVSKLLQSASATGDFSALVVPLLSLLSSKSKWFPNWGGVTYTCLSDLDRAPTYMTLSGTYFEQSLDACCKRYYNWAYHECAGVSATTPSGYFPNWSYVQGSTGDTCVDDGGLMPDYMRINPDGWLMSTVEACCARYFTGNYNQCVLSTPSGSAVVATVGSSNWYVQGEVCKQDCAEGTVDTCGGYSDPWNQLYASASACCTEKLPWITASLCEARSTNSVTVSSTNLWFVDYTIDKCVKDCDNPSDIDCGGIATPWNTLFSDASVCCKKLWFIERSECTKSV